MKCPNCGAQIPENSLYCEECGEDIHIVPSMDFDDIDVQDTMDDILEQITDEANSFREDEQRRRSRKKSKKSTKVGLIFLLVAVIAVIVIGLVAYKEFRNRNSLQYQLTKATECVMNQDYNQAIKYYNRALELDYSNINAKFELAELYFKVNNKVEYEYLMRDIVTDGNASTEQLITAYGKLIGIYRAKEEYQTIHNILSFCKNETVLQTYADYVALPPRFSMGDGYYTKVEPLTITALGNGKIFYTIDGNEPGTYSIEYTVPIVLEEGDYEIKACFINQNGIRSDVATGTFHVKIDNLPAPEVNVLNGFYEHPIMIEIMGDAEEVYYTTDGSQPSVDTLKYEGPIPMPIGTTRFRFIQVKGKKVSLITDLEVTLEIKGGITTNEAEAKAMEYALLIGKVFSLDGFFENSDARYVYQFKEAINLEETGEFYVIEEKIIREGYKKQNTGNLFAVNIYDGIIYGLQIDEYKNYSLIDLFEEEEEEEDAVEA